jgi:hypothetical protein
VVRPRTPSAHAAWPALPLAAVALGVALAGCAGPPEDPTHDAPAGVAKGAKPTTDKLPGKEAGSAGGKGISGKGLIPLGIGVLVGGAALLASESDAKPPGGAPGKDQNVGQNDAKEQGGGGKDGTGAPPAGGQTTGGGPPPSTGNPGGTQTAGQTPTAPPANDQSHAPPNEAAEEDCPQRGRGCVALIVDFIKRSDRKSHLDEVRNRLEQVNCEVDYVAPEFKELDESDKAARAAAITHNNKEMAKVRSAVAAHRERLKEGVELAIEMINAHGDEANNEDVGTFGIVGPHYAFRYGIEDPSLKTGIALAGLSRGLFHGGNYDALLRHACAWFVFDASCYSGLTARAVDTLENTGKAEYTLKPIDDCKPYAAYEQDVAVTTATGHEEACSEEVFSLAKPLLGPLEELHREVLRETRSASGPHSVVYPKTYRTLVPRMVKAIMASHGYYADNGYKWCTEPIRDGYKFTPAPKPIHHESE